MDRYIDKEIVPESNSLCNPNKIKLNKPSPTGKCGISFVDRDYLKSFKDFMKSRLDTFNPIKKKDSFDTLLISIWHHYIFHNVDESKYSNYIQILNENVELKIYNNIESQLNCNINEDCTDLDDTTLTMDNTNSI